MQFQATPLFKIILNYPFPEAKPEFIRLLCGLEKNYYK